MSQITSHILDTSRGKPAAGITISLFELKGSNDGDNSIQAQWSLLAQGQTNSDGRVPALLDKNEYCLRGVIAFILRSVIILTR